MKVCGEIIYFMEWVFTHEQMELIIKVNGRTQKHMEKDT
jgi:hypothetical protein